MEVKGGRERRGEERERERREGGRERMRKGGREGERKGGRERKRGGGRERGRGREGEREKGGKEREKASRIYQHCNLRSTVTLIVVLVGSLDAINELAELRFIAQV